MDDSGVYDNSGTRQDQPTTSESGPAGSGADAPGADAGGNKRDSISASPTIGHTIAGRDVDGEAMTDPAEKKPAPGRD